ncbi:MAG TPA: hypothetical protein VKI00_25670 [Mycobacterium sp.]|uniref:hypothetical protein n=1 Tax=Mycobacterium sp. TaxID=1785 RepID=UPI002CD1C6CF|nr:hypothetical protein [Mycobacterium sp.]HME78918.1 hypothetical protein [Mycobacterium sp.]
MASDGGSFIDGSDCTAPDGGWPDMDAPGPWADSSSGRGWGHSATTTFRAAHTAKAPGGAGFSGDYQPEVKP